MNIKFNNRTAVQSLQKVSKTTTYTGNPQMQPTVLFFFVSSFIVTNVVITML